jgi:hypothetical protein
MKEEAIIPTTAPTIPSALGRFRREGEVDPVLVAVPAVVVPTRLGKDAVPGRTEDGFGDAALFRSFHQTRTTFTGNAIVILNAKRTHPAVIRPTNRVTGFSP